MRYLLAGLIFAVFGVSGVLFLYPSGVPEVASASPAPEAGVEPEPRSFVVVELYTSEGCSSCPPADRLLTQLAGRPDVIALEFHVDYWNDEAWKDRFSSPLYTQRQQLYSTRFGLESSYTPQMVVDGTRQFVGSDQKKADEAIAAAAKARTASVSIASEAGKLHLSITDLAGAEASTVYLAVTENGLASDVSGGENRGVALSHTAVVRLLKAIGAVEKKQSSFQGVIDIPTDPAWKKENINYVVFVQENSSRKIGGARLLKAS